MEHSLHRQREGLEIRRLVEAEASQERGELEMLKLKLRNFEAEGTD